MKKEKKVIFHGQSTCARDKMAAVNVVTVTNQGRHAVILINQEKPKPNGHLAYPHFPALGKGYTFPALYTGGTIFFLALIGSSRYYVCCDWLVVMTLILV